MQDSLILAAIIAAIIAVVLWSRPNYGPSEAIPLSQLQVEPLPNPSKPAKKAAISVSKVARTQEEPASLPTLYTGRSRKRRAEKVVHGIPLNTFAEIGRNHLPGEVPAPAPTGVRVFLQCMEVKSGQTAGLSERECNELVARSGSRAGSLGLINSR